MYLFAIYRYILHIYICICDFQNPHPHSVTFFPQGPQPFFSLLLSYTSGYKAGQHKNIRAWRRTCTCQLLWLITFNTITQKWWYMGIIYHLREQLCEIRKCLCSLILLMAYTEEQRMVGHYSLQQSSLGFALCQCWIKPVAMLISSSKSFI